MLPWRFETNTLWGRNLEDLLPASPILLLLPPDDDEDDHGEDVKHHKEAGADADGQIVPLR